MQHLEEEYIPTFCISFHNWKSMDVWLNWCLMNRLWKFGLMFFRWEICGKYLGPLGKGNCFANRPFASSRVKVVQDTECWACSSGIFSGVVKQVKLLLESYLCCEMGFPLYPADFQSNCQSYLFLQCIIISVYVIADQTFRSLNGISRSSKTNQTFKNFFYVCKQVKMVSVSYRFVQLTVLYRLLLAFTYLLESVFCKEKPYKCSYVESILQSRPFGVYLFTAWRTLSMSSLEFYGPDYLDNNSFF